MTPVGIYVNMLWAVLESILSNINTIISAIGTFASATLAYFTYNVYQEQNNLIEDQVEAAKQAQSASLQTLGVRAGGINTLYVIAKNSGGGAAKNLQGVVEFRAYSDLGITTKSFVHEAVRQAASTNDDDGDWIPSEGNQIAAGESEVVLRVECSGQIEGDNDEILGFPKVVRIFVSELKIKQLQQFRDNLTEDQLSEIAETWDSSLSTIQDSSDEELDGLASNFTVEQLRTIATTAIEDYPELSDDFCLDHRLRLVVKLAYGDVNESYETNVVDLTFPIQENQSLADIVSDEFRTQRIEDDPEGYALQESG
ncbi:hypothetical protein [Haloarcula sediminis]|uniref:hypothetical protein n=1 Tax=Haloarcula sediminis TaxID=3111777 RepID=UPI002D79EE09|nr:hypothetical protein [Haloarcula sp. CK38]